MEIKRFKNFNFGALVSIDPNQIVDFVCMRCFKQLNKKIRYITREKRVYDDEIWYEYGERDYKYETVAYNDINGFIYGNKSEEELAVHTYNALPCPDCGGDAYAIDIEIIPAIIQLNKKGYKTEFSCSGHAKEDIMSRKILKKCSDGDVDEISRNKLYYNSPYIKFSNIDDFKVLEHFIENDDFNREKYLPDLEISAPSLYLNKWNIINSKEEHDKLIKGFIEFCKIIPYKEDYKKNMRENHPKFNMDFEIDYSIYERKLIEDLIRNQSQRLINPFITFPRQSRKDIINYIGLDIPPLDDKKKEEIINEDLFSFDNYINGETEFFSKLTRDLIDAFDKKMVKESDKFTLEFKKDKISLEEEIIKAFESESEYTGIDNIDPPSDIEIAKALANEYILDGADEKSIENWNKAIKDNKLGLTKEKEPEYEDMVSVNIPKESLVEDMKNTLLFINEDEYDNDDYYDDEDDFYEDYDDDNHEI